MLVRRHLYEFVCDHCRDVWAGGTGATSAETWRQAVEYGGWSEAFVGTPEDQSHWCRECTILATGAPNLFASMGQSPNENDVICQLIEANEGLGEALVTINIALGLKPSTPAKRTAAVAAELLSRMSG
ncbi:MAG: hypothetical protein WC054_00660 [Candidatus Nanopelagicales bacterium]